MKQCEKCGFATTSDDRMHSHIQEKHSASNRTASPIDEDREALNAALRVAHSQGWLPTQFQAADIPYIDKTWRNIIYTKEFAKFLWGGSHEHHLQQMIIDDLPIAYLRENTPKH